MAIGTTPCALNDNTLVQFIYAQALKFNSNSLRDFVEPIRDADGVHYADNSPATCTLDK